MMTEASGVRAVEEPGALTVVQPLVCEVAL